MKRMEVYPLETDRIRPNDSLVEPIISALDKARLNPRNSDIIVVASKVVAVSEGNLEHSGIRTSRAVSRMASKYEMDPAFTRTILDEADRVFGGVRGAILTLKDGDAVANAGADQKNAPVGTIVLWPRAPDRSARKLRRRLEEYYGKRLGVVIVDSRVTPLRLGTVGLALACAGFDPIRDVRGEPDLYGRRTRITTVALADGIADAAHLVMGESSEASPFALVRNSPAIVDGRNRPKRRMLISAGDCLYMSNLAV